MNLKSMTLPELSETLKSMGQPAFRAKQLYTWLHRGARSYDEMTNLPAALRERLEAEYPIAAPTVVLLHWQENPDHPDHEVSMRTLEILQGETDALGRPLNVAAITAPLAEADGRGRVSWSYVNVLPVNGAVVVPSFDDPHDEGAHQVLEAAYPGRTVVPLPAHRLYRRGVGLRHVGLPQPTRRA